MSFTDYCTDWFIEHLERDIASHETGRIWDIGESEIDMPEYFLCEDDLAEERLGLASTFWDCWVDARNHGWGYYRGMDEADWPVVARQIVRGLREKWEPERMRENAVFDPPPAPPRVSLWQRVQRSLGKPE